MGGGRGILDLAAEAEEEEERVFEELFLLIDDEAPEDFDFDFFTPALPLLVDLIAMMFFPRGVVDLRRSDVELGGRQFRERNTDDYFNALSIIWSTL